MRVVSSKGLLKKLEIRAGGGGGVLELGNGRFQKISIPIPQMVFRISEGEGGGVHDYGILRARGGIYDWKSEGMGGGGDFTG